MGLRSFAIQNGVIGPKSFKLNDGDEAIIYVDRAQEPIHKLEHRVGSRNLDCEGEGCKWCEAGIQLRERFVLMIDAEDCEGVVHSQRLWLTPKGFRAFLGAIDNGSEAGTAAVRVAKELQKDEDGNPRPKLDGGFWHVYRYYRAEVK